MRFALFIILLFLSQKSMAQCQAILPFTEKSAQEIHDIYQFTFLHRQPQNKLDSLVLQIMHPAMVVDSNYFDWNNTQPQVRSVVDRIKMNSLIDAIGALKTPEAFLLLNLAYMLPVQAQDDLTPLNSLCANISHYGGPIAINKYFLNHAVSQKLAFPEFSNQVILKSMPLRKTLLKNIKYCKPLQGDARILYEMSLTDPAPYDSAIEKVLNKYFNHYPNLPSLYYRDSIMIEILQLPTTRDAIWDDCIPQVAAENGTFWNKLGVIISVGRDLNNQEVYIQRVYEVQNNVRKGQKIVGTKFSADFVTSVRKQCAGDE